MSKSDPAKLIIPDAKTPRVYGILNIVFASLLLLQNVFMIGMFLLAPAIKEALDGMQNQLRVQAEAKYNSRLADLEREASEAKTDAEKAEAEARLSQFKAGPKPFVPSMTTGFAAMKDRRIVAYGLADVVAGIVLNLGMLIGGVGLVGRKEWGRRLAVGVAGTKLARLLIMGFVSIQFILPIQAKLMEAEMAPIREQLKGQPAAASATIFMSPQMMNAMSTAGQVVYTLLAAVYPVLLLIMLRKASVRAACLPAMPGDPEFRR